MVVSFHGPHFPAFFDAEDAHRFADLQAPRVPSWGVSDADDPQYVRDQAPLTAREANAADTLYRKKARSILAIRRAIVDIVRKMEEKGQLDNTYFVFTSDNGYRHGEHALVHGKHIPADVLRVGWYKPAPLHGRPHLRTAPQGRVRPLAHQFPHRALDGGRRAHYKGVRSNEGRVYVEYKSGASAGDKEMYDIRDDPYQLNNLMDDGANLAYLRQRLAALRACSGDACRSAEEVCRT
jgi:hypothetical protein